MAQHTFVDVDPALFAQKRQEALSRPPSTTYGPRGWQVQKSDIGQNPRRNVIRLMPPHPNMGAYPIIELIVHFSLGPASNVAAPCLEVYGEVCPACQWVAELGVRARHPGEAYRADALRDQAYKQRASRRFAANIVDMQAPERGVQPWYFYDNVEQLVQAAFYDDQIVPQWRNITHPSTGRNLIIDATSKMNRDRRQPKPVLEITSLRADSNATALPDMDWLNQVIDLTEELYHPTAEQVLNAMRTGQRIPRPGQAALPGASGGQPAIPQGQAPALTPDTLGGAAPAVTPQDYIVRGLGPVIPTTATVVPVPSAPVAVAPPPPPPQPVEAKRGPGRPPRTPQVATPPPPPPVVPAAPAPVARTPMAAPPAAAPVVADPWEQARQLVIAGGFATPKDSTPDAIEAARTAGVLPPCYGWETDPTDGNCQNCMCIISCMGILHGVQGLPAPMPKPA